MQNSFETLVTHPSFLDLMKLAHSSLSDLVDKGLYSEPVCYTGPGVIVQTQPGKQLIAYAESTDAGARLTIEGSQLREAIYLLQDAMQAAQAGTFGPLETGTVERLDGDAGYMSGYPQVFAWE